MDSSKVTIHMVSSLDGFVAQKNGDVSWLQSTDTYEKGISLSDEDITKFLEKIDCYVMGSKTYEHALELGWPYGNTPVIVLTSRALISDKPNVQFYSGGLLDLTNNHLKPKYNRIWVAGGPETVKAFMRSNLVNEIILSIMPVVLGDGQLFFDYVGEEQKLHLEDVTAYSDGMVELTYAVNID